MTTEELASRLAAHERFRWREGMQDSDGFTVLDPFPWPTETVACADGAMGKGEPLAIVRCRYPESVPDLTDTATAGVLVAMLAEAWEDCRVHYYHGTWYVALLTVEGEFEHEHLGVAVAKALLVAWGS